MSATEKLLTEAIQEAYDKGFLEGVRLTEATIQKALLKIGVGTLPPPPMDTHVRELGFPERPRNCLVRAQVCTLGELLDRTEDDILAITNIGRKSLDQMNDVLAQWSLKIKR